MNSRAKGARAEREFAALLRENGFDARRGQQFCGGGDSPDVVCAALPWLHVEVKRVQALNLVDACAQAQGDCGGKPWIVAHRRNHAPWLVTMRAEMFFALLRGELPPAESASDGAQGLTRPTFEPNGGRSAIRPTNSEVPGGTPSTAGVTPALPISAAASAAANSENKQIHDSKNP